MRFSKITTTLALGAGLVLGASGLGGCGGMAPSGGGSGPNGHVHEESSTTTAVAAASAAPTGAPEVFRVGDIAFGETPSDAPPPPFNDASGGEEAEGDPDPHFKNEAKGDKPHPVGAASKPRSDDAPKPADRKESVKAAVVDATTGLSQEEVRATISNRQGSFRACYTIGAASGPFSGTVFVRASVGPTGSVASAEVTSSTTKNIRVDSCVLDAVRVLQFPAKGGGAVVSFPIEFGGQ